MTDDVSSASVLARLDVQDLELAVPIREFLTSHGCIVFVNEDPPDTPEYHIIYGEEHFVKKIALDTSIVARKRLMILSGETATTAENFSRQHAGKTALVGLHQLPSRTIAHIFAFFFTGHKRLEIVEEEPGEEIQNREPEKLLRTFEDDRRRIADTIAGIFAGQPAQKRKVVQKRNHRFAIVVTFLFCFFTPLLWYVATTSLAGVLLILGVRQLRTGDNEKAGGTAVAVRRLADQAEGALRIVALPFRAIGGGGWFRGQERLLSFLARLADAEQSAAILVSSGKETAQAMIAPLGVISVPTSAAIATEPIKEELATFSGSLGLAQSELAQLLKNRTWPFGIAAMENIGQRAMGDLAKTRVLAQEVGSFFALYPGIAGFKEKKTYLLLLQNSMELRPTGGFIGSVATLSLEEGRIADFAIQDVYALDGQLKGHVDPPEPLGELLGLEHWYLRDSNWDPDFSVAAARAAWFYEKESGSAVDGVIGINVPVLLDILTAVGSVDLSDYNDRITAENFFGKSIYYTQANFFPGSTQKKDFLGALSLALLTKITGTKYVNPALLRVGVESLGKGNVLLWFADRESQAVVERLGWAGKVVTEGDRLFWVEANLSVNKVNYFIKRTIRHHVVFAEDGSATESVGITLTNTSLSDEPKSGGGTYRVYGRLILPADAATESVTLDGTPLTQKSSKKKETTLPPYVVSEDTSESRIVGVALDVPRGGSRQLVISYRRQTPLEFVNNQAVYDLFVQKQPGIFNTDISMDVTFPVFWQPKGGEGGALSFLANQARLGYNSPLSENRSFTIEFQK